MNSHFLKVGQLKVVILVQASMGHLYVKVFTQAENLSQKMKEIIKQEK